MDMIHTGFIKLQQAPNVTMGAMTGPAPPYPQAPRGMQPQQTAQYQQQMTQQRMRMLAMQQQGPLAQHLQQRQQYQPPY